jgi:hypothetical protein
MGRGNFLIFCNRFCAAFDFNQCANNASGVSIALAKKSQGRYPMSRQSNHHDHWINGNLDERVMVTALVVLLVLSPFYVLWFY